MEVGSKKRVKFLFFVFSTMFLLVVGKAFKVQVLDRKELIARSKSQFFREAKVYPKRGNIYDRNGNPLAINIQTYSIFTIPKNIKKNKWKPYRELSKIEPRLSLNFIKKRISNRKNYTWLARKIELTKEQVKKIKKLEGIYIDSVPKRVYPNHEVGSQILGFVGVDNIGLSGVEYSFDKELRGEPTVIRYIKDAKGRAVKFERETKSKLSKDLYLSIDKEIQSVAEKYLKQSIEKFGADHGGVGVMDVETGEILAMANYPSFDPNEVGKSKARDRGLSFIASPFEPGSTMKSITVASAFENKISTPETSYYCERGAFEINGHVISEAESKKKFEWLSVKEILEHSSNIGTTKIAFDLTYPKLKKTFLDFGFGKKTGIELPGESRGIMTDKDQVTPLSLSNISFGQGIATTGLQMMAAYGALANNGVYVQPTIIKGKKTEKRRVLSIDTAVELEKILESVVENGTGGSAKIKFFNIAGKTSTAQRVDNNGGYKGYVSGFIGYPVNVKNRFVVYAYVDNPKEHYYGSVVAAPVVREVMSHILYRKKEFDKLALDDETETNGVLDTVKVRQSSPRKIKDGDVPNFIGLDKRSVKKLLEKMNVNFRETGIGIVESQSPPAGTKITSKTIINIEYSPPSYD